MAYQIKATAPTGYQASSLSRFNLNENKPDNGSIIGILDFDTEEEAKHYLKGRANMYYEFSHELETAYADIENGALTIDAVTAYISQIDEEDTLKKNRYRG